MGSSGKRKKRTQKAASRRRSRLPLSAWWLVGGLAALLVVGAVGVSVIRGVQRVQQVVELDLPGWVLNGSEKVQAGYTVATSHAEELEYIPCYCSCGALGHTSVLDCFISGTDANGAPVYDKHASY